MTSSLIYSATPISTHDTSTGDQPVEVTVSNTGQEYSHLINVITSYSGDPATAKLTIKSASTIIYEADITVSGHVSHDVCGLQTERGEDLTVTLAAGGSGVQGKVNIIRQ